jgi:hypothetical protein
MNILAKNIRSQRINAVRKTNFRLFGKVAIFAAVMSLTSCVKDDLYNTPHPDKGAVVITTDWTEALAESTVPDTYLLRMDDGKAVQASEETTIYPDLLAPGAHTLLIYNEPEGITVEGNTASIDLKDGMLVPLPDYLFSAEKQLDVMQDDTLRITIPMQRRLCPIILNLDLNGENADEIARIEATLSGMAGSVDLRTGTPGSESLTARLDVRLTEVKTRATAGNEVEMKCRVTGTAQGERQILTVKVTMEDGQVSTITSDLTENLKDLNADMEPVRLEGSIEAPQDGNFSGTIKDWDVVSGDDIDAN